MSLVRVFNIELMDFSTNLLNFYIFLLIFCSFVGLRVYNLSIIVCLKKLKIYLVIVVFEIFR